MRLQSVVQGLIIFTTLASSTIANTYIVDVNGSGQFTDIPPAIAAAANGDVIVVRSGAYSPFGLIKSLAVVGTGGVTVNSAGGISISIGSIPGGQRVCVANMHVQGGLTIGPCPGQVIVQDLSNFVSPLNVDQCADVRLLNMTFYAATIAQSRVELVKCSCRGAPGIPNSHPTGYAGVDSQDGNRMHFALTSAYGGVGADGEFDGGNGGDAIDLQPSDTLIFAGGGDGVLLGGDGDPFGLYIPCYLNGFGGAAVRGGSTFRYSFATISSGASWQWDTCAPLTDAGIYSGGATEAMPFDPTLELVGTPTAGTAVQFVLRAPAGSTAKLNVGREAILVADGLAVVEQLAPHTSTRGLGTVPATDYSTLTWHIPAGLPTGTFLVAQADVVLPGGELRRTNSTPIIVR